MKDHLTCHRRVDAFLIDCGQEWSSVARREEIYQALTLPVTPFYDFFSPKGFVEEKDRYRFATALSLSSTGEMMSVTFLCSCCSSITSASQLRQCLHRCFKCSLTQPLFCIILSFQVDLTPLKLCVLHLGGKIQFSLIKELSEQRL